jgi:hypothetical protein
MAMEGNQLCAATIPSFPALVKWIHTEETLRVPTAKFPDGRWNANAASRVSNLWPSGHLPARRQAAATIGRVM